MARAHLHTATGNPSAGPPQTTMGMPSTSGEREQLLGVDDDNKMPVYAKVNKKSPRAGKKSQNGKNHGDSDIAKPLLGDKSSQNTAGNHVKQKKHVPYYNIVVPNQGLTEAESSQQPGAEEPESSQQPGAEQPDQTYYNVVNIKPKPKKRKI